jgi:ABC-type multidrug transport system ATPase subunit
MTTHYLDESDFLADNIVIMYKGSLKAQGTSATLKNRFGNGYTVKLPEQANLDVSISGRVEKEAVRHHLLCRVATASLAAELVEHLKQQGIKDYQVSGPTMEELFLKTTGDTIVSEDDPSSSDETAEQEIHDTSATTPHIHGDYHLTDGRPLSAPKQWWLLFCKRFQILRRRFVAYSIIIAFSIAGAGVAPLLIKGFKAPIACPAPADLVGYSYARRDLAADSRKSFIIGPPSSLDETMYARIVDVYSSNRSSYPLHDGFKDIADLKRAFKEVNTYENFTGFFKEVLRDNDYYRDYFLGGMWLADTPTAQFLVETTSAALEVQNMLSIMMSGASISAGFKAFPIVRIPDVININAFLFMVYFGLIMASYPAFFALYPTNERISNVRSMQYSNGIRPLPLWLSHLAFDAVVVLVIAIVGIALLSVATPVWVGLGYVFLVMLLYGIVSALLSYVFSMFAKSPVTAWFMCALGQVIFLFGYLGGMIGVQASTPYLNMEYVNNALYFGLGIVAPIVSLERGFAIGLGQLALQCNGHSPGSVYLYGGPILYLILQGAVFFTILLWWDSSFSLSPLRKTSLEPKTEEYSAGSSDTDVEMRRLRSNPTDLRIEKVSKAFGKNLAVDNVSFGVQTSEIFALLGPNGAGKSTIISMIRGDIKPSSPESSILIAGHSILSDPITARSHLGVCPQFDSADVLTVKETLRFFAKIRGVADIDHNVSTVIKACGLGQWENQLAQKLSGGTKRKLSLAVALVGNPQVLVPDEPSSALDADAKRKMWQTLQSISKGRAVVLTTHSMEEADALADRIGIVSSRMLTIGEREALKKRAGDAFHVHLVARSAPRTTAEELEVMKVWVYITFDGAKISRETQGGQIRFEIPSEGHELLGLMRTLEHAKGQLDVEFYSVGKATLDEVFENVLRRYGDPLDRTNLALSKDSPFC